LDEARLGRARQELRRRSTRDGYEGSELVDHSAKSRRPDRPEKGPEQSRNAFDQLSDFITPSELFYIRSHFPTSELDPVAFRLRIRGAVRNELSLSYAAIRAMSSRKCVTTLECVGNSRVFLTPPVPGAHGNSAQSATRMDGRPAVRIAGKRRTGRWRVRHRFGRRRPRRADGRAQAARSNLLCSQYPEGAGDGTRRSHRLPDERAESYAGPRILRAIVLGFYGMSSVKWSTDTVVATQPFQGYWQTSDYGIGMITKGYPCATRSRK